MTKKKAQAEAAFLATYDPKDFPRPSVTVDLVILTITDADLKVLLVERGEHPFQGRLALPGGFVRVAEGQREQGEGLDEAAARELAEETGLEPGSVYLEQLAAFGAPLRDPRTRVISVAYFALVRPTLAPLVRAGGDARAARWVSVADAKDLAFDHDAILAAALARVKRELDASSVAFALVPETFSIQELRAVHEVVRGEALDPGNFRKRFLRMVEDGVIEPARGKRLTASKPASVYRFVQNRDRDRAATAPASRR
ncbi:MAG: NUDIX hydrolase [Myxococcales bacterium]|nr:NUDIX hydrolase [Myxococcales bacterium]